MNQNRHYGMPHCRDKIYGAAAVLSYWVFKCRDRKRSPSMGTKTWTYLESSIKNSAEISNNLEKFLSTLCDKLISFLRPSELNLIISPNHPFLRAFPEYTKQLLGVFSKSSSFMVFKLLTLPETSPM